MRNKNIFIIDRNPKNIEILKGVLEKEGYSCLFGQNYWEINLQLNTEDNINLAIIDIIGFDEKIWEICKIIQKRNISFLILSSCPSTILQQESIKYGARAMVTKPLNKKDFLKLVNSVVKDE